MAQLNLITDGHIKEHESSQKTAEADSGKSTDSRLHMHVSQAVLRFGQVFASAEDEAAFKASLEPELLRFGSLSCVVALACWCVYLPTSCLRQILREDGAYQFSLKDVRTFTYGMFLSATALSVVVIFLIRLRSRRRWFLTWNFELLILFHHVWSTAVLSFGNGYHASIYFGQQPAAVWGYAPIETNTLLSMDLALTMFALYVPVRSCVQWILPAFGLIPYLVLLLAVGSASPRTIHSSIMLSICLAIVAVHGQHRVEQQRRKEWIASQKAIQQLADQRVEIQEQLNVIQSQRSEIEERGEAVHPLPSAQFASAKEQRRRSKGQRVRRRGSNESNSSGSSRGSSNAHDGPASPTLQMLGDPIEPDIEHFSISEQDVPPARRIWGALHQCCPIEFEFDATTYTLLDGSLSFRRLLDVPPDDSDIQVLHLFSSDESNAFFDRYQNAVNEFLLEDVPLKGTGARVAFCGELKWRTISLGLYFRGTCTITLVATGAYDAKAQAVLTNVMALCYSMSL